MTPTRSAVCLSERGTSRAPARQRAGCLVGHGDACFDVVGAAGEVTKKHDAPVREKTAVGTAFSASVSGATV